MYAFDVVGLRPSGSHHSCKEIADGPFDLFRFGWEGPKVLSLSRLFEAFLHAVRSVLKDLLLRRAEQKETTVNNLRTCI